MNGSNYLIYREVNSPDNAAICVMTSYSRQQQKQASSQTKRGLQLTVVKLDSNCNEMESTKYLEMVYHGKSYH